jgi:hypothetical protein
MFDVSIGGKVFPFMLDSGSNGPISLTKNTARQIGLSLNDTPKPLHLPIELLGVGDLSLPTGVVVSPFDDIPVTWGRIFEK